MDLRASAEQKINKHDHVGRSVLRGHAKSLVCLTLCIAFFGTLLYMTMRASFIGGLFLTIVACALGAIVGALMARASHRVVGGVPAKGWFSPLRISCLITLVAAGLISYVAFDKVPTASWVTGIPTLGPLGPILAIPAAGYFWQMAKRFSSIL